MTDTTADEFDDEAVVARFSSFGVDHDSREHYRGRLRQDLLVNRCTTCARWHQPPRPRCPACWSTAVEPTPVSGRGTIHLVVVLYQGPTAAGVDYTHGHPVVSVDLEEQEGLRFTATLVDADLDEIRIGRAVELAWRDRAGTPTPVFHLVDGAQ